MDICFAGLAKAGKTSIIKMIFQKMCPQQTCMLESTIRMDQVEVTLSPLIKFKILDFAGTVDFKELNPPEINFIENCGALIFVMDVKSESQRDSINYLLDIIKVIKRINQKINYHIFIHKTDSEIYMPEENKTQTLSNIRQTLGENMENEDYRNILIDFYLTTLYDHSLYECFSKVIQKVIKQVPHLTHLLDSLITNCKMEKAFLFEIVSKLFIATDSAPVDIDSFAICSEMIDVFLDISYIYGSQKHVYDPENQRQSIIKLSDGTILLLKEVEQYLALICIIKENSYDRPYLIDYNIDVFKKGLTRLFNYNYITN